MRLLAVTFLASVCVVGSATGAAAQPVVPDRPTVQFEVGYQHEKAYEDKHFNGWVASLVVPTGRQVSPAVKVTGVYRSASTRGSTITRDDRERLLSVAAGIRFQRWRTGVRPWG